MIILEIIVAFVVFAYGLKGIIYAIKHLDSEVTIPAFFLTAGIGVIGLVFLLIFKTEEVCVKTGKIKQLIELSSNQDELMYELEGGQIWRKDLDDGDVGPAVGEEVCLEKEFKQKGGE